MFNARKSKRSLALSGVFAVTKAGAAGWVGRGKRRPLHARVWSMMSASGEALG